MYGDLSNMRIKQGIKVTFILMCLTVLGSLLTRKLSSVNMVKKPKHKATINATKTTILLWYWPLGKKYSLEGDVCYENFGVQNCDLVDSQSKFSDADFVVFHHMELVNGQQKLPVHLTRPQKQRWVWFTQESPENNWHVKSLAGYFNCTMSYRHDADIYAPYGRLIQKDFAAEVKVEDFIPKNKSYLACWVVSNFLKNHKRTAVYDKLKTVIPVQVYGGAVGKRLDDQTLLPTISRCFFYLAFENSIYKDYITEKFWYNALMGGSVPVVLGPPREQYEAMVPKDSFIHVDDFSSVEELGEFLKKLAEDQQRYASYFNWRMKNIVQTNYWIKQLCEFCPRVSSLPTHKIYEDLDAWQWG